MHKRRIHIIHQKKEICSLIKKSFLPDRYKISCSYCSTNDLTTDYIYNIDSDIDCIILDKGLGKEIKDQIKTRFSDIPIICLPSLDSDSMIDSGIKYISEPFKVSELSIALDEIFNGKEYNEK